jgi:hypothetical protein
VPIPISIFLVPPSPPSQRQGLLHPEWLEELTGLAELHRLGEASVKEMEEGEGGEGGGDDGSEWETL